MSPDHPLDLADALVRLLEHLSDDGSALAVGAHLDRRREEVELAVRALDAHPLAALADFVAPPHWDCFGLAVSGIAHGPEGSEQMRLVFVIDRDHECRTAILRPGRAAVETRDAPVGEVADLCRRVLPRQRAA